MTTINTDKLITKLTAFKDWQEMAAAMASGYVPTLFPSSPEAIELRNRIVNAGGRVFPEK